MTLKLVSCTTCACVCVCACVCMRMSVCCNVLQCVAVGCSVLQYVSTCCSELQGGTHPTATHAARHDSSVSQLCKVCLYICGSLLFICGSLLYLYGSLLYILDMAPQLVLQCVAVSCREIFIPQQHMQRDMTPKVFGCARSACLFVGLFCLYVGLFCMYMGLFCIY